MAVKPIPDGYHSVTPYIMVEGAQTVLEFAKQVFGAEELYNMTTPDGKLVRMKRAISYYWKTKIAGFGIVIRLPKPCHWSPRQLKDVPVPMHSRRRSQRSIARPFVRKIRIGTRLSGCTTGWSG